MRNPRAEILSWLESAPLGTVLHFPGKVVTKIEDGWQGRDGHYITSSELITKVKGVQPPPPGPDEWETKDGRRLLVTEMDDDHLVNVCNFLRRKMWAWAEFNSGCDEGYVEDEDALPTPEEVSEAYWRLFDQRQPFIEKLVAEVRRRDLDGRFGEDSFLTDLLRKEAKCVILL